MNIEELREFCLSFEGTEEKMPFGPDTLVFYVSGKMFCLTDIHSFASINLKCDPEEAIRLREEYSEVVPGYHMNKKHWNTISTGGRIPRILLEKWILDSYNLVVAGLPKKLKEDLKKAAPN